MKPAEPPPITDAPTPRSVDVRGVADAFDLHGVTTPSRDKTRHFDEAFLAWTSNLRDGRG
jgi:hypothetical protein